MACYTDRIKGVKEVTYDEAFKNVKDDLRYQLIWVHFKDEPDFVKIIEDDDAYDRIYGKLQVYIYRANLEFIGCASLRFD